MELTNLSVIREITTRHGMRLSKSLGQNFLINPSVCPRIAEMGGANKDTCVLEIGPGIGTLTKELAKRAKQVLAIELDGRLPPVLEETLAGFSNIRVVQGDAMKMDLKTLMAETFGGNEAVVCANLPYYITSPLIMRLLEERLQLKSITVMVQKEAAQRICAPLPSRDAGAITAAVHYYARPQLLFSVAGGSFYPPPKVESSVLRLDLHKEPPVFVKGEAMLFRVIGAAFSQRRKILLNCLSAGLGLDKNIVSSALKEARISDAKRAEQLSMEDFALIANAFSGADEEI